MAQRFGMTALHWAAYGGKLGCVQALLKAGASMSITDANGRNALHHACRKDHDEVVRYLVSEAKMDVNSLSESSDTPLHKAGNWTALVGLLLEVP
jgi:ankyrin repeat protein